MKDTGKTINGVPVYTADDAPDGIVYVINTNNLQVLESRTRPEIILGNPSEEQVQDQVRKQVGDDREIIGGGPDTGFFTGVR